MDPYSIEGILNRYVESMMGIIDRAYVVEVLLENANGKIQKVNLEAVYGGFKNIFEVWLNMHHSYFSVGQYILEKLEKEVFAYYRGDSLFERIYEKI